MKTVRNNMFNGLVWGIAMMLLPGTVRSDDHSAVKVTIEEIKVEDLVYTPYYQVETEQIHDQGSAQRWVRLGVYFRTEGGWIDELDITQMALIEDVEGDSPLVLSEKVHYINVEPGDHYVYVYLHPSYVKRYELESFDVDSAAIVSINGNQVDAREIARHAEKGWSVRDAGRAKGYLLNHAETPFWFINYDFKELIKHANRPDE